MRSCAVIFSHFVSFASAAQCMAIFLGVHFYSIGIVVAADDRENAIDAYFVGVERAVAERIAPHITPQGNGDIKKGIDAMRRRIVSASSPWSSTHASFATTAHDAFPRSLRIIDVSTNGAEYSASIAALVLFEMRSDAMMRLMWSEPGGFKNRHKPPEFQF